ncbi:choice-of-anchor K domain-containing protein [Massilia sp. W12]|uniref:choice-of-anchor K domain-containing protein n=1 Tax=Massilia sp. W12 TaxID=3126507 RepID=UPI0030D276AD
MKKIALAIAACALLCNAAQAADNLQGSTSAIFTNPSAGEHDGVGSRTFTWGNPAQADDSANRLSFRGNAFSTLLDTPFKLGTLSYFNGSTTRGSNPDAVDLRATLQFSDPAMPLLTAAFKLGLNNTNNTRDAQASADYLSLGSLDSDQTFSLNGVSYRLHIEGFRNVSGGGYLSASGREFHVMEDRRARADLYASVSAVVPEAQTWGMLLAGLGGLGLLARRRQPQ